MDQSALSDGLSRMADVYAERSAAADRRRAAAAAAGNERETERAWVEAGLLRRCSNVCHQGYFPVVVNNSVPIASLPKTFDEVRQAAAAAGIIQTVQLDNL